MITPEKQRKAIATVQGWLFKPNEYGWSFTKIDPKGVWFKYDEDNPDDVPFPNYLNDLNAMQSVLKTLNTDQRRKLISELCIICDRDFGNFEIGPSDVLDPNEMTQMFIIDATPAQYAEAFLKALGLWVTETETN